MSIGLRRLAAEGVRASSVTRDIVIASTVALALGLFRLGTPSFWVDEAFTARAIRRSFPALIERQVHLLYYSLQKPWAFFAGTSEWALRMPSVFGAMLACGLLVVLAHKLFDRRVALISGLFLATNPFLVKWSQQARAYTLLVALSLLATLLLIRALDRGSRAAWAFYGVAFSVVLVWQPVSGLLLVPVHAVLAGQRREHVLPHGLTAAVVASVLAVPWVGVLIMRSTGEGAAMNWLEAPTPAVATHALLDVSGAAGLGTLLAIVGLWALHRAGKLDLAVWLGVWAFAPFLIAFIVSPVKPVFLDRYLIVAAPAFALLAAVAVMGVGSRLRTAMVLAAVIATSIGLFLWYSSADRGNWRGEDWRSAVRTVLARRGEGDAIVVAKWPAHPAAEYYGARVSDISTSDSIWVLVWTDDGRDLQEAERRALGFGGHRLVERIPFGRRLSAQLWRRPAEHSGPRSQDSRSSVSSHPARG